MKTRSALPTLALAALLVGLVPALEARAEPEKPGVGDETPPEDAGVDFFSELKAKKELELLATRLKSEQDLAALRAAVAESTRTHGPEHKDTLAARRELAEKLFDQAMGGDDPDTLSAAAEELLAVLALAGRPPGKDAPAAFDDWETAVCAAYLRGESEQADRKYRALLPLMDQALGPADKKTFLARLDFAVRLGFSGQKAEAEGEFRTLVAVRGRVQDPELTGEVKLRRTHADLLDDLGRHAEAEAEYRIVLPAMEKEKGPLYLKTLGCRSAFAGCLLAQGKAAEALRELEFIEGQGEEAVRNNIYLREEVTELLAEARKALAASADETPAPAPAPPASGEGTAE